MFVGHCGAGFVAKRFEGSIPLWVLFIAALWLDVVWCTLVLLGINKVQILGGYAQMDPYYMPYDHALVRRFSRPWQLVWHIGFGGEPMDGWPQC